MFFFDQNPAIIIQSNQIMKGDFFLTFREHIRENSLLTFRQLIVKDRAWAEQIRVASFQELYSIPVAES